MPTAERATSILRGFDLGQVEDVVDEREQVVAGRRDAAGELHLFGREIAVAVVGQQLGEDQRAVERRAQLVRHVGQELGLVAVGACEFDDLALGLALGRGQVSRAAALSARACSSSCTLVCSSSACCVSSRACDSSQCGLCDFSSSFATRSSSCWACSSSAWRCVSCSRFSRSRRSTPVRMATAIGSPTASRSSRSASRWDAGSPAR